MSHEVAFLYMLVALVAGYQLNALVTEKRTVTGLRLAFDLLKTFVLTGIAATQSNRERRESAKDSSAATEAFNHSQTMETLSKKIEDIRSELRNPRFYEALIRKAADEAAREVMGSETVKK